MNEINEQIKEYLNYYLSFDYSPGFAVMLTGEWGSGKTYFINDFLNTNVVKNKYIYISLYGVTSLEDIDTQIIQQLFPKLSQIKYKLPASIFKSILSHKYGLNIRATTVIKNMDSLEDKIIIIDDLERVSANLNDVLGYINDFVEHKELKVIVLCNPIELNKYLQNKNIIEKVVGKKFEVEGDVDNAFESFLNILQHNDCKEYINNNKFMIIDIYNKSLDKNLRNLKHAMINFETMYKNIEYKFWHCKELIDKLLFWLFVFSIEINSKDNSFTIDDISKIPSFHLLSMFSQATEQSEKDNTIKAIEELIEKHEIGEIDCLLRVEHWTKFFNEGYLSREELTDSLNNTIYFAQNANECWIKLKNWGYLSDKEYTDCIQDIELQLQNLNITKPFDILNVYGVMIALSSIDLYSYNTSTLFDHFKAYSYNIKNMGYWLNVDAYQLKVYNLNEDMHEFTNIPLILDIIYYMNDLIYNFKCEKLKNDNSSILELLSTDFKLFEYTVNAFERSDYYKNIPVLKYINSSAFFDYIYELSNENLKLVPRFFRQRYEPELDKCPIFNEEKPFIEELNEILHERLMTIDYVPSKKHLQKIKHCLESLLP